MGIEPIACTRRISPPRDHPLHRVLRRWCSTSWPTGWRANRRAGRAGAGRAAGDRLPLRQASNAERLIEQAA
jgi:hypothetical protein